MLMKLAAETTNKEAAVSRLIMARFWVAWYKKVRVVVIEIHAGRRRRGSEDAPER